MGEQHLALPAKQRLLSFHNVSATFFSERPIIRLHTPLRSTRETRLGSGGTTVWPAAVQTVAVARGARHRIRHAARCHEHGPGT